MVYDDREQVAAPPFRAECWSFLLHQHTCQMPPLDGQSHPSSSHSQSDGFSEMYRSRSHDFSPRYEQSEQCILAHKLQQPIACCIAIFHKYFCYTKHEVIKTNLTLWNLWGYITDMFKYHMWVYGVHWLKYITFYDKKNHITPLPISYNLLVCNKPLGVAIFVRLVYSLPSPGWHPAGACLPPVLWWCERRTHKSSQVPGHPPAPASRPGSRATRINFPGCELPRWHKPTRINKIKPIKMK